MIVKSNFLIIGSTGRNTGKTEFACKIIERQSGEKDIIGVKIIPVDPAIEKCHRGYDGCGLCDSLTGEFEIIEEKTKNSSKDTSRMLKAGAKKAYLLIVDRSSLEIGMTAMLNRIPSSVLVIAESNTLRKVLEPGLFIVLRRLKDSTVKSSCAEVIGYADKIIEYDDKNWNIHPDKVSVQDENWIISE